MAPNRKHVILIHGLWLHATSWEPWVEAFTNAGYTATAPGWPGDSTTVVEARRSPERVAPYGINEVVDHYRRIISQLDAPPIVVGHSFGGVIVQRLLAQGSASAGIAVDAAPVKGVLRLPLSALRVASIALRHPSNNGRRAVSLTPAQFRYGFGNAISEQESNQLYERWTIPSPGKPLFEVAFAAFSKNSPAKVDSGNSARGPLLLIAGGKDHTVPASITRQTLKLYSESSAVTEYIEFADRGHTLCLDSGWPDVADTTLRWLKEQGM